MAPLDLTATWGTTGAWLTPFVIGMGFGAVLEMSGFGDSRKLAAQFYLKDLTVLKVMFTAIIVAAVLLGLSSALGLLDFERVFVPPTFLVPGLVGGLIMGVGFIVGGFCPGTSVVASATLKIDGVLFLAGVFSGVFVFGETVASFDGFWHSTAMGRFTLPELFGVDAGVVIVLVVLMALVMFLFGGLAESWFARGERGAALRLLPRGVAAPAATATLAGLALLAAGLGQPDATARWERQAETLGSSLEDRSVYVHPMEVAELTRDPAVVAVLLDLRSEPDYNLFHLKKSRRITLEDLEDPDLVEELKAAPGNTVFFAVSNDDDRATAAWKLLAAQGVPNVYILEGGINRWLEVFPPPPCLGHPLDRPRAEEELAFVFLRAVGDCCNSAYPEGTRRGLPVDCRLAAHPGAPGIRSASGHVETPPPPVEFERKVKLQKRAAVKGGCS